MLKNKVNALVSAIKEKEADEELKWMYVDMVRETLSACNDYVKFVAELQELITLAYVRYEADEARDRIETMDRSRRYRHEDLISKVNAVNRACARYGVEPVVDMNGKDRADYGEFALEVVNAYFKEGEN